MENYIENPKIQHINREEQRSYYIPYTSANAAIAMDKDKSDLYRLLNGKWKFKYFKRF